MAGESKITNDHQIIKKWAEDRGGKPARVKGMGENGILRFNFPGFVRENLEEITWEEFFRIFDEKKLALLYQEETAEGQPSRFFKFVKRKE